MSLSLIWYVAVGGAIGSVARFAVTEAIQSRVSSTFPVATLLINVAGSLLLGFISRVAMDTTSVSDEVRVLLTVGLCGGFTTFSTFTYEAARLIQDGNHRQAGVYAIVSVVMSLVGLFAGLALARMLIAARTGST
jgi:CrcB protein